MLSHGLNLTSCTCFLRPRSERRIICMVCPPGSATLCLKAAKISSTQMIHMILIQLSQTDHLELQMFGYQGQLSEPKGEDLIGRPKLSANEDKNKNSFKCHLGYIINQECFLYRYIHEKWMSFAALKFQPKIAYGSKRLT